jgi:hypothetical protein
MFFELGKLKKVDLLEELGGRVGHLDFVRGGLQIFDQCVSEEANVRGLGGLEYRIELLYCLHVLEEFYNKRYIKYVVYKDATASAVQLLMVLLESDNVENLRACNLIDDGY